VTEESNLEDTLHTEDNHITVAFGSGIVGSVALTKTLINIKDAYQVIYNFTTSRIRYFVLSSIYKKSSYKLSPYIS